VTVDFVEGDMLKMRYWWDLANGNKIRTTADADKAPTPGSRLTPLRV